MGFITICSMHKILRTSLGEVEFHEGEAKLEAEIAKELLKKFPNLVWSKKKGKPEESSIEEEENDSTKKSPPKKNVPEDSSNFGFPENVHISSRARKALLNGKMSAEDLIDRSVAAKNNITPPNTNIIEDMVKGNATVNSEAKTAARKLNVVRDEGKSKDLTNKVALNETSSKKIDHKIHSKHR